MIKKFLRLIIREPIFLIRALVVLILLGIVLAEAAVSGSQAKQYAKLEEEKRFVDSIPEMEKRAKMFRATTVVATDAPVIPKAMITLEGTGIKNDILHALIDGTVYQKGDRVGDYQIIEIQRGSVTLENVLTKEQKNLQILEYF